MTYELLTGLFAFAFVMSITPGPNNLMLLASGANFGLRATVPHMAGVSIGFVLMTVIVGGGLVQLFDAFPASYQVLKIVSLIYLAYLAWKIANAAPPKPGAAAGTPITFLQACAFQWVNPKAWAMSLTAISAYAPDQTLQSIGLVAVVFGLVNLPSVGVWVVLGLQLARVLTNPARLRAFNITMAVLLLASLYPVLFS